TWNGRRPLRWREFRPLPRAGGDIRMAGKIDTFCHQHPMTTYWIPRVGIRLAMASKRRLRKQRLKDHLSARADFRRSNATRFFADENIEPWVVWLMRRNDLDVVTARELGTVGHDDQAVFSAAWRLKRVIVTHDFDFMNDTAFP